MYKSMKQALKGAAAVGVVLMAAQSAQAFTISYFNDNAFVDASEEATNMAAELTGLGHVLNPFTGTTDGAWAAALGGATHLVIPELESSDLNAALSGAARTGILNFVQGGGIVVIAGDNGTHDTALLNATFGYSLVDNFSGFGFIDLNDKDAAGSPFEGGPDPLLALNGTRGLDRAGRPPLIGPV